MENQDFDVLIDSNVSVLYRLQGLSCYIDPRTVPSIKRPFKTNFTNPFTILSNHTMNNLIKPISKLPNPLLVDIFHPNIIHLDKNPTVCPKCQSYFAPHSFPNGEPTECPFCTSNTKVETSVIDFPVETKQPVYIFVVAGVPPPNFYKDLESFPYEFVLAQYSDTLTICKYNKRSGKYSHLEVFDAQLSSDIIMSNVRDIPEFSPTEARKYDMTELLEKISNTMPNFNGDRVCNIVVFSSLPHQCVPDDFQLPGENKYTLTIISSHCIRCNCRDKCAQMGGNFFSEYSFLPPVETVTKVSLKSINFNTENTNPILVSQNTSVVNSDLPAFYSSEITFQLTIETQLRNIVITHTLTPVQSLSYFFDKPPLAPFLVALSESGIPFIEILKITSSRQGALDFPFSLRYAPLFSCFPIGVNETIEPKKHMTVPHVLSMRPFVLQVQPTLRVLDFLEPNSLTSLTLAVILVDFTLYVFVGGDIPRSTWRSELGLEPPSGLPAFHIYDAGLESATWDGVRQVQAHFAPWVLPVIAVPGESGRRVQLVELMGLDYDNRQNKVLAEYAAMARTVSKVL